MPRLLLPPPSAIAAALVRWRGLLLPHSLITLYEAVLGFRLGIALGVPMAIAVARMKG